MRRVVEEELGVGLGGDRVSEVLDGFCVGRLCGLVEDEKEVCAVWVVCWLREEREKGRLSQLVSISRIDCIELTFLSACSSSSANLPSGSFSLTTNAIPLFLTGGTYLYS